MNLSNCSPIGRSARTVAWAALACLYAAACSNDTGNGVKGTNDSASTGGGGEVVSADSLTTETVGGTDGDTGVGDDKGGTGSETATPDGTVGDTGTDTPGEDVQIGPDGVLIDTGPDTGKDTSGGDTLAKPDGTATAGDDFKELLVKILGPSGREWIQSAGANTQLSGVAFGNPDQISWASANGKTGTITAKKNWQSSVITLDEGDNHLTVTAKKGDKIVTDTVHITYNPVFSFEGAPEITPNVLFVKENAKLVVHFSAAGAVPGSDGKSVINPTTIQLVEVDSNGKPVAGGIVQNLVDSGQGGNCDDVQKDAVFSQCLNLTPQDPKTKYFRVKANVDVGIKQYEAWSAVAVVDVVARFDKALCNQIVNLQSKTKSEYQAAVEKGTDWKQAQADAIAALKGDSTVADAGPASGNGFGVWVRYKTGQLGALNLAPDGLRAGSDAGPGPGAALPSYSVGARRALALAPFQSEFSKYGGDEADKFGADLKGKQCPPYVVDAATGSQAYLRWYREMANYGMVAISGHGEVLFGNMDAAAYKDLNWEHQGAQEVIFSGEPVNCNALSSSNGSCNQQGTGCPTGETCVKTSLAGGVCVDSTQADLMLGRAVIGDATYGFVPSFLKHHLVSPFPQSIIYLGACRSMYNGSMAVTLWGNGAASVVGFSDYVNSDYAYQQGAAYLSGAPDQGGTKGLVNGQSTIQALPNSSGDPKYGGRLRHVGIDESNLKSQALINPSWDGGSLTGWKPIGDGRVVSRLGVTIPVAGKYMGIISTGLGFTAQNGSLTQPFCVDKAQTELCFYWKFYSEEFKEWCGSQFMDTFTATLKTDANQVTMTNVYIDSLCPYDCEGKSPCEPGSPTCKCGKDWKGLSPSDAIFDQGGVFMTPWQKQCQDITPLAGTEKKVDLTFFATDKGDSIYDTVILLDEVTVK